MNGHRARGHGRRAALLIVLSLVLAFAFQGSRGLYETTEGRYAESAREMLETGDWLVPRLDYEPHWSKPPLTYWALAGGMALLGENEWGVRLAPALAYLVTVWAVHALGAAMWGRRTAFAAALVYATAPFVVMAANSVSTDPFLAMWEALSALAYWKALSTCGLRGPDSGEPGECQLSARVAGRWIVLFWLFSGLGFLTKGPPALLTMLVVFVYHGWRTATRRSAPALASPLGIAAFLVSGFSWFIVVGLRYEGLLEQLISEEVVGRVADPGHNRNPEWYGPFVIVLPFVLGVGAWLAWWAGAWRRLRLVGGWRARVATVTRRDSVLFCLLWAIIPTAILCTSRSRLPLYVLPFVPALALLTGRAVDASSRSLGSFRRAAQVAAVTAVVMVAAKGVSTLVDSRSDIRPVYREVAAVAGPEAEVYAYELTKEHGLMFYLGGRMTRVSADPAGPRVGISARDMLDELSAHGRARPAVVVARSAADELAGLLADSGFGFERVKVGRYTVFGVAPLEDAGASDGRAPPRA